MGNTTNPPKKTQYSNRIISREEKKNEILLTGFLGCPGRWRRRTARSEPPPDHRVPVDKISVENEISEVATIKIIIVGTKIRAGEKDEQGYLCVIVHCTTVLLS